MSAVYSDGKMPKGGEADESIEPQTETSPPSIPDAVASVKSNEVGVKDAIILKEEVPKVFGSAKLAEMVPPKEMKKLLPLAMMFFCVLFNYTILRNTKDVLVVTAPGSGAEVIPFLKTYVQLPGAIVFTIIYSKMCNSMSPNQVFYSTLAPFLGFYSLFAFAFYPLRNVIHPHATAAALVAKSE